ncbi:hypothetical protein [Geothrix fuzhouensis]|uniref:hypothetical protein n=1 Tax=Geothrix fuzhouensis TaxID=2966451 RepID=UPI0021497C04|nr:hypothetical protein [Geothrix fuzhouensis]
MVAFLADHPAGDLRPDPVEIEDARWFHFEALPHLLSALSIARWMLDAAVAEARSQASIWLAYLGVRS